MSVCRSLAIILCAVITTAPALTGQSTQPRKAAARKEVAVPASPPAAQALTVEDVVAMLEAKISEPIIVAKVKKAATALDPTPAQLVALKKAGATDALMAPAPAPAAPEVTKEAFPNAYPNMVRSGR